jgi:hypothetical protein
MGKVDRWFQVMSGSVPCLSPDPDSIKKLPNPGIVGFFQWHMRNIWLEFRLVYKVSDAKV